MHMYMQILGGELEGECCDFEAASGHGLKCSVRGVESYAQITKWKYVKGLTRHVMVQSDHTLMQDDLIGATPTRQYQVRELPHICAHCTCTCMCTCVFSASAHYVMIVHQEYS